MADERLVQTREWLSKARNDWGSAKLLITPSEPFLDTAAFHCQQTVEKLLKAFLTYHAQVFERTHNLTFLCNACAAIDVEFAQLRDRLDALSDYAVHLRYPGEEEPTLDEIHEALAIVRAIWDFVLKRLPDDFADFQPSALPTE
jgi:HEPN domain-containing protein